MRRFSIARLMAAVSILAVDFWLLRLLLGRGPRAATAFEVLAGLIPLANALLLACFVVVCRTSLRPKWTWRAVPGVFPVACAATCAACLLALAVPVLWGPQPVLDYMQAAAAPYDRAIRGLGVEYRGDTAMHRYVVIGVFLCLVVSGPPLLLSLGVAWLASHIRLETTPRDPAI